MKSDYKNIFKGSLVQAKAIINELKELGIHAIEKNENESARLAGFGGSFVDEIKLYVHTSELELAKKVMSSLGIEK